MSLFLQRLCVYEVVAFEKHQFQLTTKEKYRFKA